MRVLSDERVLESNIGANSNHWENPKVLHASVHI